MSSWGGGGGGGGYKEQIYKQGHRRARRTKPVNEKSGQNERRCYRTAIRPAHGFDS
ncbi:MAG: hypothetical protein ACJ719_10445 [Nitrososphaeraceae archaeon]